MNHAVVPRIAPFVPEGTFSILRTAEQPRVAEEDKQGTGLTAHVISAAHHGIRSRGLPLFSNSPLLRTLVHSLYCSRVLLLELLLSCFLLPPRHAFHSLASSLTCLTNFVVHVPL